MKMPIKLFTQTLLGLGLVTLLFLVNGCSEGEESPAPGYNNNNPSGNQGFSVQIATDSQLGNILVDRQGRTLYFFTRDAQNTSACEEGCLNSWPVFYESSLSLGEGLEANDFATITRNDGSLQTTYKGWPLYYFAPNGDATIEAPGLTAGENVGNVWFVARANYLVMMLDQQVEDENKKYLVDDRGRTLYFFANDNLNVSNCEGACLEAWPAYNSQEILVPTYLNQNDFSVINRNDGSSQIAFRGRPLYYFIQDEARGDTKGQRVNDVWFVTETKISAASDDNTNIPEDGY